MRRYFVFIAMIVFGVVLGAPFVVGRLAQARQADVLAGISENIVGARMLTEDYRAGWLTSTARHRIVFDDRPVGAAIRDLSRNNNTNPSLVIETRLAHGPWPALNGSPGFARLRSTLRFESGDEQGFEIPGEILTVVEFNGDGRSIFAAQPIDEIVDDWPGFVRWDGGLFNIEFDGRGEVVRYSGDSGLLRLSVDDAEIALGAMQISGEVRQTSFGFRDGNSHLSLESVRIAQHGSSGFDAQDIEFVTRMDTADRLVNQSVRLDIGQFESPRLTDARLHVEASTERLDAQALGRLIRTSHEQDAASRGDDLQDLLQAGPELRVETLQLQSAQGDIVASIDVTVPTPENTPPANPADVLQTVSGQGNVSISPGILSIATGNARQAADLASTLVTMGYLLPQDGNYVADIFFKGGLMTINGLPMIMPVVR